MILLCSANAFSQIFICVPLFPVPFTLRFNVLLIQLFLSFLYTCLCQRTLLVLTTSYIASLKSYICIRYLSTSCQLISLHIYFSPWLFQYFAKYLSQLGLCTMSRFHEASLISHSFYVHILYFSEGILFRNVNLDNL